MKKRPGKGFGIAGMVLGIVGAHVSVMLFCFALAMSFEGDSSISSSIMFFVYCAIYSVLGIIFSGVAISKGYKNGVGKSGLVLGIAAIILNVIASVIINY